MAEPRDLPDVASRRRRGDVWLHNLQPKTYNIKRKTFRTLVVKPELEPARSNYGTTVRPPIVSPTRRNSESGAIMPAAVRPSISASITPTVTPRASTVPPAAVAAFTPIRPVYSDSVDIFRSSHLVLCGLGKHLPYFRNPFSDSCVIAGPGTDRACFRLLGKQTSTGRKL